MNAVRDWWLRSAVRDYYRAQSSRDQLILIGVGALLAAAAFVVLVWRPAHDWRTANESRYERNSTLLAFMRANQDRVRATGGAGNSQSLLMVIGDAARDLQVHLSRFQPESSGSVTVVMDDEEFDKVVRFVDVLEREHQLVVRQVSIDRKAPGRASVRLEIR